MHARLYFYLDPGFSLTADESRMVFLMLRLGTSANRVRASLNQNAQGDLYLRADLVTPAAVSIYNGSANAGEVATGQWHLLEVSYVGNSAAGGGSVWLNGNLLGSVSNQNTTGLTVDRIEIGGNSNGSCTGESGAVMHIDNLAVGTSNIGAFASADPEDIFDDGFESGDLSAFQTINTAGGNSVSPVSAPVHGGVFAADAVFAGASAQAYAATAFQAADDVFARGFFRLTDGFDMAAVGQRLDLLVLKEDADVRARVGVAKSAAGGLYLSAEIVTPSAAIFYTGHAGEIESGRWYALELRYRGGSGSTGGAELWLDGRWLARRYDLNTTGLAVNGAEFGGNGTGLPIAGSKISYDDFRAAPRAIGLAAAATPINTLVAEIAGNWDPKVVDVDGVSLYQALSLAQLTSNGFYHDNDSSLLYVRFADDGAPAGRVIAAGRRDHAVQVSGKDHLRFQGLTFVNANRSGRGAFQIEDGDNISIRDCGFYRNFQIGVLLKNSDFSEIINNDFADNREEFGGGIRLEFSNDIAVEHNTITGFWSSGIMVKGFVNGVASPSRRIRIHRNHLHGLVDAGIYFSYNVFDSEVSNNLIHDVRQSTYLTGQNSGGNGVHIAEGSEDNVAEGNLIRAMDTHGVSFRADSAGNTARHNTVYVVGRKGSGSGLDMHDSGANSFYNNVVAHAATACINVDTTDGAQTQTHHNLCHNPGGDFGKWQGSTAASLADFQQASGKESGSLAADALFTNAGTGDFSFNAASPVWGAGIPFD